MTKREKFSIAELVLSLIGICIAGTLYYAHRTHLELPCTTANGCELVGSSRWAFIFGIPVTVVGLAGYSALFLLSGFKLYAEKASSALGLWTLMFLMAVGGTAFSWYLQYMAAVYVGAFCIWCRCSAITMTVLMLTLIVEQFAVARDGRSQLPQPEAVS